MKPDSPEFKKLQKQWDKKLKDAGFDDIEQRDGKLKVWSDRFHKSGIEISGPAKFAYYRAAGIFLNDYAWPSVIDQAIWAKHADGKSYITIINEFANEGVTIRKSVVENSVVTSTVKMRESWKNPSESED